MPSSADLVVAVDRGLEVAQGDHVDPDRELFEVADLTVQG